MIDRAWLESLRFERPGVRLARLHSVNGESVTFFVVDSNGREILLKVRRHHLGFHIRELFPDLAGNPSCYSVRTVNEKLARLVGHAMLDSCTSAYDRLYSRILLLVHERGVLPLLLGGTGHDLRHRTPPMGIGSEDAIRFILRTPGIRRRLEEWATLEPAAKTPSQLVLTVNGPSFPFRKLRPALIEWATATLNAIDALPDIVRPEWLCENPLYVWGAAVTDGFFTDDEMPEVASFIEERFGLVRKHARGVIYLQQAKIIATLLGQQLGDSSVDRFVKLCGACGVQAPLPPGSRPSKAGNLADETEQMEAFRRFTGGGRDEDDAAEPADDVVESTPPPTPEEAFRRIGRGIAQFHEFASHGDLHKDNIALGYDRRLLVFDLGRAKVLGRSLTPAERADDLLTLRLDMLDDDVWDLIEKGYREKAPAEAQETFVLLEETLRNLLN